MFDWVFELNNTITLIDRPPAVSREVKPVWAAELDAIQADKLFSYDKGAKNPLLWRVANRYFYKGDLVFKTHNKGEKEPPEIELAALPLAIHDTKHFDEITSAQMQEMFARNAPLLDRLTKETVQIIRDNIREHGGEFDAYVLSFSGGKDSTVLLAVTLEAFDGKIPLHVNFSDTHMEYDETLEHVNQVFKKLSKKKNVTCSISKSEMTADESWSLIGFPSRLKRWCCKVHKVAPSFHTLKRKGIEAPLFITGQRASESIQRAKYEIFTKGAGELSTSALQPILKWGAAEIWLYILSHNLPFNPLYKRGAKRVGCILCPMGANDIQSANKADVLYNIIKQQISSDEAFTKEHWKSQTGGLYLPAPPRGVVEKEKITPLCSEKDAQGAWLGVIDTPWQNPFLYTQNGLKKTVQKGYVIKALYCIGCGVCGIYCPQNAISFEKGEDSKIRVKIDDRCIKCFKCLFANERSHDFCLVHARQRLSLEQTKKKAGLSD